MYKSQSLASVIIPVYNPGEVIKETIGSVTEQTYSNLEIIIIDDGSTDDTAKIVKSINDDRIKYHYQSNTGIPAQARNKGARLSKGK
ncbi:MAG: glycosyltransferase family A protein, partial [Candidatus Omnitrophica bacterium]|nr:glycosyltransferase family A protein [Candidatus Omnitrophota bacterium]